MPDATVEIDEDLEAREAFEAKYKHLGLAPKSKDAWGRLVYLHPHIESTWSGWRDCWKRYNRPDEKFLYAVGDYVRKEGSEVSYTGFVVARYRTRRGRNIRYVIEVEPQGFQMIANEQQIQHAPSD